MADYIKNVSIEELREKYFERHGFAFVSPFPSSDEGIERLAQTLRNQGISRDFPLLVTRINNATVFVYENLDAPYFFKKSEHLQFMGLGNVIPLVFFLKENIKD